MSFRWKNQINNMSFKSTSFIFFSIIFLCIFNAYLVISEPYTIDEGFWTPLRFLGEIKNFNFSNIFYSINALIESSAQNDSVKFFPSIIESFFFLLRGLWEPRVSISIGILSWLACSYLFYKASKPSEKDSNFHEISRLFIVANFLCSPSMYYIFNKVFAIHRTLPSIAVISTALILYPSFKKIKDSKLTRLDTLSLSFLSIISTFSFANGFILIPITLGSIYLKKLSNEAKNIDIFLYLAINISGLIIYFRYLYCS